MKFTLALVPGGRAILVAEGSLSPSDRWTILERWEEWASTERAHPVLIVPEGRVVVVNEFELDVDPKPWFRKIWLRTGRKSKWHRIVETSESGSAYCYCRIRDRQRAQGVETEYSSSDPEDDEICKVALGWSHAWKTQ